MKRNLKKLLIIVFVVALLVSTSSNVSVCEAATSNYLSSFSISKKTIYKGNGVSISLYNAKKDSNGLKITFMVKNNSEKDYSISAHEYAINNLMAGGSTYGSDVNVPKGKKAKFTVEIKKEWFVLNGIKTFKKFDVMFWAYGDSMKEWESGKVSFSTNKDNGKGYYKPSKNPIISDKNMSIGYVSKKNDTYKFYVQNKTELERRWSVENCSVNDWSYDLGVNKYDLYSEPILDGCYAVFDLTVDKKFKTENSIKTVKTIEFNIEFEGSFTDDGKYIESIESEKALLKIR